MLQLDFVKAHGTGNDFIIYADPEGQLQLSPEQIAALCDRHFGIGADGLIRAVKSNKLAAGEALAAQFPEAEWFMDYYNNDGSTAEMCGNGVRAYVHYLLDAGLIAPQDRRETVTIGTRAGIKDVLIGVAGYSVDLGRWQLGEEILVKAANETEARPGLEINLGNPHTVCALPTAETLNALNLETIPTLNPAPPAGSNIEFAVPDQNFIDNGVAHIHMRVYERGVGETLSCGTGAVAAALAFRHWGGAQMPHNWKVTVPGGVLGVRMFPTEDGEHVALSGPAKIVYRGTIEI